jgi:hypothetical protein
MNYSIKLSALLLLGVLSCTNHSNPSNAQVNKVRDITPPKVLMVNSKEHYFSNLKTKDIFKISLIGDSVYSGKILLEVFNHGNKRLFADTFPAFDLLGDLDDSTFSLKHKEDSIKMRMKDFFAEDNFVQPAVTDADSAFWDDNTDMKELEEIKKDTSAIGFVYSHGYEGTYYIGYLKRAKKVVTYLSHD